MTAVPPANPTRARSAGPAAGPASAAVERLAPEIARLAPGAMIEGTVGEKPAPESLAIKTDLGEIVLKTALSPPPGSVVTLKIQTAGAGMRAAIVTLDPARATESAARAEAISPRLDGTGATQAPRVAPAQPFATQLQPGVLVAARAVSALETMVFPAGNTGKTAAPTAPSSAAASIPSNLPPPLGPPGSPAPPGATLTLRILDVQSPTAGSPPAQLTSLSAGPAPFFPSAAGAPTTTPAASAPLGDTTGIGSGPNRSASAQTVQDAPNGRLAPALPKNREPAPPPQSTNVGATPTASHPIGKGAPTAPAANSAATNHSGATAPPGNDGERMSGPTPYTRNAPVQAVSGSAAPTQPASASTGAPIGGTVVGPSVSGGVVLATPNGPLAVAVTDAPPAGTRVTFEVASRSATPQTNLSAPDSARPALALAQDWPALRELVAGLEGPSTHNAAQAVDIALPQPGPRLAQSMLFFIAALRLGDIANWLGAEKMTALHAAGRGSLAARLADDFRQLSRIATDGAQGDWRAYIVPFHDGEGLSPVRFFHRRYGGGSKERDNDGEHGDRFLIDVRLSRLGAMQLDGHIKARRFDLIVRSATPFEENARRNIEAIFRDGCACADVGGDIRFAAGGENMAPLPFEAEPSKPGGLSA